MKKAHFLCFCMIAITLSLSCWPLVSEDKILGNSYVPVTDSLSTEMFIGEWVATDLTYQVLDKLNYTITDSLRLALNDKQEVVFSNMPGGIVYGNWSDSIRTLGTESGHWKVERSRQFPEEFVLNLSFKQSETLKMENGFGYSFFLYRKDGVLTLLTYMDDPDQARIVSLQKK